MAKRGLRGRKAKMKCQWLCDEIQSALNEIFFAASQHVTRRSSRKRETAAAVSLRKSLTEPWWIPPPLFFDRK